MPLAHLDHSHIRFAADLHARALADSLLPSLGVPFLESFYRHALRAGPVAGFVWSESGNPIGLVLGSTDSALLIRHVLRSGAGELAWKAAPAVLRRPRVFGDMLETLRYPDLEKVDDVRAELMVIAVEPSHHQRGIGRGLSQALHAEFVRQGVTRHKVTVHRSNVPANTFYARLGYQQVGEFRLHGRDWNLYTFGPS